MVQDFAKKRTRTPLAEPEPKPSTSSLGLLVTGLLTGIAIGLFISLLVYLSGVLPPAPGQDNALAGNAERAATPAEDVASTDGNGNGGVSAEQEREAARLQLEFYQELPNYEVVVDASPVNTPQARENITPATPQESPQETTPETTPETIAEQAPAVPVPDPVATTSTTGLFMLQAGAFRQQTAANAQANRLLALGLDTRVRQEDLPGRTLFLVQAGPYDSRDEMMQAERILRNNSIESMRITLSQP
ncbi:MAG: SPOR domain-containing protein [Pseudohongiella sp.]|uniref:SPOR domain-containing protein n=1 Tax=Pseudohongiella sp. TaxID=1979412 RepID=UPI0034A03A52